jgi:putative oxidoreductase
VLATASSAARVPATGSPTMNVIRGLLSLLGRLMIVPIFLLSAVGNKIPRFNDVAESMAAEGVPQPKILLAGAIAFLILGSLSIAIGYRARLGALMLLLFLGAATYYYHDFWNVPPERQQEELIAFMKNLSLMGTMVFLLANGAGPMSLDGRRGAAKPAAADGDADDQE